jgi:hypothetical protein
VCFIFPLTHFLTAGQIHHLKSIFIICYQSLIPGTSAQHPFSVEKPCVTEIAKRVWAEVEKSRRAHKSAPGTETHMHAHILSGALRAAGRTRIEAHCS